MNLHQGGLDQLHRDLEPQLPGPADGEFTGLN